MRVHTERKSVEEPGAPGNLFTRKLAQLLRNNHLPVLPPLDFVPIRHVQNQAALETEKTMNGCYVDRGDIKRTAQDEPATDPGPPGVVSGTHVLLLAPWDDTLPQRPVEGYGRAIYGLVAKHRHILLSVLASSIPSCTC